ncbi:hypothetical protein MAN_04720, partial [Metarhizium hybridum]
MVDIGKRDLLATGKLDMNVSLENRDYCYVEIGQMGVEKPEMIAALLRYKMQYYAPVMYSPSGLHK